MSNLDVERRLTEVLHRHAEDAMTQTDTQHELREFLTRGDQEPTRTRASRRGLAVLGAGVAAAVVAGLVAWSPDLTPDRERPAPVQEPTPASVQIAEEFVAAYATNDTATVTSMAADPAEAADWRILMARNDAWGVEFIFEPCQELTTNSLGSGVACLFSLHVLKSREVDRGPFENAIFSVWVDDDGKVFDAEPTWNHELNGMGEHVEEVTGWVLRTHPAEREFLELEEQDVPPAQFDRWARLWQEYVADYVRAHGKD